MKNETVVRKLIRDLKDEDVIVTSHMSRKGLRGGFNAERDIQVSSHLSVEEQLVTLIHEYLHYLDSTTSEEIVESRAYEIFTSLNDEQYGILYFFLQEAMNK